MVKRNTENKQLLRYLAAVSVAAFTAGGYGIIMSWTSPALRHFKSNKSDFQMTKEEMSWIAPLVPIGFHIGYLLIPFIINRFDRKWILMFYALPQIISWLLIALAKNHVTIYIARILGAIGYGGGVCALTVFLSEVASQKNRGIFLSFQKLFLSLGIFITMLLSASLSYNYMNYAIFGAMTFFVFTFSFMPSSAYFRKKNNQEEINSMLRPQQAEETDKGNPILDKNPCFNFKIKESDLWKLLTVQANRKAISIVIFCAAQDVFSGHVVLRFFTHVIFAYNASFLSPENSGLLLASVKVTAALICTQVIERVRRKVILLITGFLGSLGMGLVGLFFFLEHFKVNVSSVTWLPLFGLCMFDFMLTIGISNFFFLFAGELFPRDLRGLAITLCKMIYSMFGFFSIWQFQFLIDHVDTYVVFWLFAATNAILGLIILKITPETQGKSIEEIQVLLKAQKIF